MANHGDCEKTYGQAVGNNTSRLCLDPIQQELVLAIPAGVNNIRCVDCCTKDGEWNSKPKGLLERGEEASFLSCKDTRNIIFWMVIKLTKVAASILTHHGRFSSHLCCLPLMFPRYPPLGFSTCNPWVTLSRCIILHMHQQHLSACPFAPLPLIYFHIFPCARKRPFSPPSLCCLSEQSHQSYLHCLESIKGCRETPSS